MGKELKKFKLDDESYDYTKDRKKTYHKGTSKRSDPNPKGKNNKKRSRNYD